MASWTLLAPVALVVLLAALLKGITGFGFPLIAVPVLALVLGPLNAIVVVAVPNIISNLVMVLHGRRMLHRAPQVAPVLAGVVVGTVVGARTVLVLDPRVLALVLGGMASVYAIAALARGAPPEIAPPPARSPLPGVAMGAGVGAVAGVLGGATSSFAPLLVSYLDTLRLGRDAFVAWITALFLVGNTTQALTFAGMGVYGEPLLAATALLVAPMLLGNWAGIRLRARVSPARFRVLVLVLVLLSGLNLILGAVRG